MELIVVNCVLKQRLYPCPCLYRSGLLCGLTGRGDGFFLACEDFERMFDHSFPACASFLSGD